MDEREYAGVEGPGPRRVRNPGKMSLNRGLSALAVSAGGYLIGFLIPFLSRQGQSVTGGRWFFWPTGGILAFLLAVFAIQIGRKTRRFIDGLPEPRRERLGNFMDLELERKKATAGVVIGILAMVANPLVGFFIFLLVRR